MRRDRARLLILAFATALFVSACFVADPVSTPALVSPVDGVVISVDAVSLTDVRGFTLRSSAGLTYDFKLGDLENATDFSPSHLKEHQATSVPIRVWFQLVKGDRVVYRLEDASATPGNT
ncbi:MAG TPA: hypothetical protein VJ850_01575 [Candidatus Limnocylindrales bacterium]|nr:hypothetical protein [Candidatus Limnocylindrales bacterium]